MLIHVQMSSSAKADDPVCRAVRELASAGDYCIPAGACHRARQRQDPVAGMTTVLGAFHAAKYADRKGLFVSCAFAAAGSMLSATPEKPEGVRMSALQPVSGKSHAAGNETYDVVVAGAGFDGMYMAHRLRGLGLTGRGF